MTGSDCRRRPPPGTRCSSGSPASRCCPGPSCGGCRGIDRAQRAAQPDVLLEHQRGASPGTDEIERATQTRVERALERKGARPPASRRCPARSGCGTEQCRWKVEQDRSDESGRRRRCRDSPRPRRRRSRVKLMSPGLVIARSMPAAEESTVPPKKAAGGINLRVGRQGRIAQHRKGAPALIASARPESSASRRRSDCRAW